MMSINVMFSCDLALRRCEVNRPGLGSKNHTLLNEDLIFYLYKPVEIKGAMVDAVRGGSDIFRQCVVKENVKECLVHGVTHKVGLIKAEKMIERRTNIVRMTYKSKYMHVSLTRTTKDNNMLIIVIIINVVLIVFVISNGMLIFDWSIIWVLYSGNLS